MYLIQVLLPLRDNQDRLFPKSLFKSIDSELVATFGGVTAFSRSPGKGKWSNSDREQLMAGSLDREWWKAFRNRLEVEMSQSEIVVRALLIDRL
jgi:hypothetical protein